MQPATDALRQENTPVSGPQPGSADDVSHGDWLMLLWLLGCFVFMWILGVL
jgi:hypothetical protein